MSVADSFSNESVWARFDADPRTQPRLRASDADRNIVFDVLGRAFAAGRLDVDEHSERMNTAAAVKTLGEAVPLIEDLVTADGAETTAAMDTVAEPAPSLDRLRDADIPLTPEAIEAAAHRHWKRAFTGSLVTFLVPTLICITIWLATGAHAMFWPIFVVIGTGMGMVNTLVNREKMIRDRKRVLTKRARARLGDEEAQQEIAQRPDRYRIDDDDDGGSDAQRSARRAERHERRKRRHDGE